MKMIIHIGTPKTGSTSIQKGLFNLRKSLREQHCLYPGKGKSHHAVAALVRPFNKLRRYTQSKHKNNPDKIFHRAEALRTEIKSSNANTVLLSSEFLCRLSSEEIFRLIDALGFSPADVYAICYVRQPSRFYLSAIQQKLKASVTIPNPFDKKYDFHGMLQSWISIIGKENVVVRAFDREQLHREDVVSDLLQILNKEFSIDLSQHKPARTEKNTSLSAEACILMQELRRELLNLEDDVYTDDSRRLVRIIKSKSAWMRLTRMKFRREIVSQIDRLHKSDLEWLKQGYGIEFTTGGETTSAEGEAVFARDAFATGNLRDLLDDYDEPKLDKLRRRVVSSYKWKTRQAAIWRGLLKS
ncbi:MAG: hypothetical protein OQK94_00705 [Gammaproteobacteria bacterium]|nr:hypothetical protein [Gammaproteobacteria bacterium]MCW8840174.1 hypothetical protein [Gammaproteobacteria bacterium]MCW8959754.1 hypothetical protein [Gammaproteobacteria bacterium]MCW8972347.1 hypothetical protein [Gammaproteobacteria bacterium]MCW8992596.1 hypothetical protein [Gammaproteobacteria bacterium]